MPLIDYENQISEIMRNFDFTKVQDYLWHQMKKTSPEIGPPTIQRLKNQAEKALREVTKAKTLGYEAGGWYARRCGSENTLRLDFSIESWDMLDYLA